jgi:hypothetical protein
VGSLFAPNIDPTLAEINERVQLLTEEASGVTVARDLTGIPSADTFWTTHSGLVHFTSAFRYPVFCDGENYNGQVAAARSPTLTRLLDTCLVEEAAALPDALWIPLGSKAGPALQYLVGKRRLQPANVLSGMLHPSPASMERIQYFLGTLAKEIPSPKTNGPKIDDLRASLIAKVAALPAA